MNQQTDQQELPLLSVIVQAYNIEKELLDRCVSSIVQQTYTNLEIILINNRSTDDTGKYCEEWLTKDHRIQVIHKIKGDGILSWKTAHGEYMVYVDHDDWIDPNMYFNMMSAMLSTHSDIARCEFCFAYPDGSIVHRNITHKTDGIEIVGQKEGVLLILENDKWQTYRWQNIYKRSLFDHYKYPQGDVFGDLASTHILFHHAKQTVYLHDVYYYYYQRPGISVMQQNKEGKKFTAYCRGNSHYERYLFVKQHPEYHSMLQQIEKIVLQHAVFSIWDMIDYPNIFPKGAYGEQVERLKQFSLSLRGIFYHQNLDLWLLKKFPRCYKLFYRIFFRNFFHKCLYACYKRFVNVHN